MSSVKFHPGCAGKLEEQRQQQSCWLVLAAERAQQRGGWMMGCGAEGGARGINRGREGRLAQGHGAACVGAAGGCGEDEY